MNRSDLNRIRSHRGFPALSLRLPTHRRMPGARQDPTRLKNLVRRAGLALQEKGVTGAVVQDYLRRLEAFQRNLDYRYLEEGLCVFVSPERLEAVMLPEKVEEAVVVGETFLTRDLVRLLNRQPRYSLLVLSEKTARWFKGWGRQLVEDTGSPFPMADTAHPAAPPEGFNKGVDPQTHSNERLRVFLRRVAEAVSTRQDAEKDAGWFLAGVERLRSFYIAVSGGTPPSGQVDGNLDRAGTHQLWEAVAPEVETWQRSRRQDILDRFDALKGTREGIAGLEKVGEAAVMGKVEILLLENSYVIPGTFDRQTGKVQRHDGPREESAQEDVVDQVLETVIGRGGEVVFYRDGRLALAGAPIGAILRF
ncbi:MAG: hypothetical protein ACE5HD_11145 [Acidobacteriota bacterium]